MSKQTSAAKNKNTTNVVQSLSRLLADTYLLYVKTQNFHWNVTGPHFYAYHQMFEAQYKELAEATDLIAERIRALEGKAPASMSQFLKLTTLKEASNTYDAEEMIDELLTDHVAIAKSIVAFFEVAKSCDDEVTLDILIQRKTEHDKTAWMLRSSKAS